MGGIGGDIGGLFQDIGGRGLLNNSWACLIFTNRLRFSNNYLDRPANRRIPHRKMEHYTVFQNHVRIHPLSFIHYTSVETIR